MFLLGWLVWGILLKSTMDAQLAEAAKALMRPETDMVWWALIVGNLAFGFLLAIIFGRWANIGTFSTGAMAGAAIGFLVTLAFVMIWYAMTTIWSLTGGIIDIVASTVVMGIVGGIVGWWMGRK